MNRLEGFEGDEAWAKFIGKSVCKLSGKPFKSGQKTATVKAVIDHPMMLDRKAFLFEEDDSYVATGQCELA